MKKIFLIAVTVSLLLSTTACGNNAELEALKKENAELKAQLSKDNPTPTNDSNANSKSNSSSQSSLKQYNVGEPVTVKTEKGDYNISVISASKAVELNQDGNYPIILTFEVENISYAYDKDDKYFMPWDSYSRGGIIVSDNERNILKYYDISGPKEVHNPENVPIGFKERGTRAFFPVTANVMPESINVQIGYEHAPVGVVSVPVQN